jgi:Xaa-Pro aminopeptidase
MNTRIKKTLERAKTKEIDALLITGVKNVRYFTGFTGDSSHVLIWDGGLTFFTDFRYTEQAQSELSALPNVKIIETGKSRRFVEIFEAIQALKAAKIGLDEDCVTLDVFEQFKPLIDTRRIVFFSADIHAVRAVKDEDEINAITWAARETDNAFYYLLEIIRPGVTEEAINAELKYYFNKKGMEVSFPPIVISGTKTSLPHGQPSGKVIEIGDLVTMDFGCVAGGYCSDFTRTFAVGKASDAQRKIYEIVRSAQNRALEVGKAGISSKVLDNLSRQVIIDKGYGKFFDHGLGHGVGLDIHEPPFVNAYTETFLEENMVVTVEPGIYLQGQFGIRIEDLCIVKKEGLISLSTADKQFMVI